MSTEAPSVSRKTKATVPKHDALQRAEKLIQTLAATLEQLLPENHDCDSLPKEEVLLDRTVGEAHYVLIRMPVAPSERAALSPRENEIVRMVARGHPTKVIADVLNISCWTVSAHLRRIFIKLGVTSRPAMIARLAEEGFGRSEDLVGRASPPACRNSTPTRSHREPKPQARTVSESALSKSFIPDSVVFANDEALKKKVV